jgi:hypothetical protein
MFAHLHRNRSGSGWFMIGLVFSPLVAFVLLAVLHPAPVLTEREKDSREQRLQKVSHSVVALLVIGLLALVLFGSLASAQQQTFRDPSGRNVGTSTQSGNQTTFRDSSGRSTGTATTDSAGNTVFRDARGNVTGATVNERVRR